MTVIVNYMEEIMYLTYFHEFCLYFKEIMFTFFRVSEKRVMLELIFQRLFNVIFQSLHAENLLQHLYFQAQFEDLVKFQGHYHFRKSKLSH